MKLAVPARIDPFCCNSTANSFDKIPTYNILLPIVVLQETIMVSPLSIISFTNVSRSCCHKGKLLLGPVASNFVSPNLMGL
jgi:hypothetical protein